MGPVKAGTAAGLAALEGEEQGAVLRAEDASGMVGMTKAEKNDLEAGAAPARRKGQTATFEEALAEAALGLCEAAAPKKTSR